MAARPAILERPGDEFPMPLRVMRVDVGATSGDVLITSSAVYPVMDIPAGCYIYDVGWRVTTAFNSDVDLNIGTTDDADGFAQVADVAATVADTSFYFSRATYATQESTDTLPAYGLTGYITSTAGAMLDVQVESTTATTGAMTILVFYTMAVSTGAPSAWHGARKSRNISHQYKAGL